MKKTLFPVLITGAIALAGCGQSQDNSQKKQFENELTQQTKEQSQKIKNENEINNKSDQKINQPQQEQATNTQSSNNQNSKTQQKDFHYDEKNSTYYGKLEVNGYVTLQEVPQPFCEKDCQTYTYASFNILETDNEFIDDYLGKQKGNSFVGEMGIGLGCVEDKILWRFNDSDDFGMKKYKNSLEESEIILSSSPKEPTTLELERHLYTSGRGAPACYSHFAVVKAIE